MTCDFAQVYGVNYEKIFVLTICYDILCIFFVTATKNNWKIYQVDIVIVF